MSPGPNRSVHRWPQNQIALERCDRFFDLFGPWLQPIAEFGQAITRRVPDNQIPADALFQFGKPAMNRRLAEIERLRGRDCAAMASHRQEMPKVVPFKHELFNLDFARRNLAAAVLQKIRLWRPTGVGLRCLRDTKLRQHAANGPWICLKIADDFAAKSADNGDGIRTRSPGASRSDLPARTPHEII
jgi:hypothetical protein